MIADELKILFDDLRTELLALKTDLIICKYGIEQIENKIDELIANQQPPEDPYKGKIVEKF